MNITLSNILITFRKIVGNLAQTHHFLEMDGWFLAILENQGVEVGEVA
jgi:hypothetical protein